MIEMIDITIEMSVKCLYNSNALWRFKIPYHLHYT